MTQMLTEQYQTVYRVLLAISQHSATFVDEKALVKAAQDALATADIKQMWIALVDIALRQGFHTDETRIIHLAQIAMKQLLYQMRMLNDLPGES